MSSNRSSVVDVLAVSTATHSEQTAGKTAHDRSFVRARMGSLLAFFPLGVWSINHLWNNLAAFQGGEKWAAAVTEYPHPAAQVATGVVVLVPVALHTAWGIKRLASARPNNLRYGFYANLKYALQRLSAIGLLLFLGAHLWLAMLRPRLTTGRPEPFADIAREMHFHAPTLIVYVLGTLGLAYHLANGLHTFTMGWGLVASRRALRKLDGLAVLVFVILLAMGWGAIYALYSAVA
jgi:succinate dehydrogenase / fumarate reductase, cytochrome b subunit